VLPAGFSWLMIAVTNNSQIQIMADDAIRGRVMGFYAMGALGSQAMGALLLGALADLFGVRAALMLGGAACLVGAAFVLRRSRSL
jgi:MFS family permease